VNLAAYEQAIRARFGKFRKSKTRSGTEYKVCCSFCLSNGKSKDTSFKLYINPQKGVYRCWRCDTKGPVRSLFSELDIAEESVHVPQVQEALPVDVDMPGELALLTSLDPGNPAIEYLVNTRSVSFDPAEVQNVFGARYCIRGQMFSGVYDTTNTIIFPMFFQQRVVGWQSRMLAEPEDLTDQYLSMNGFRRDDSGKWMRPPKYFTSPGFPKGRVMFNFDLAIKTDFIVICEGVFDAMAVGNSGVATLGKGVTDEQVKMIATYAWNSHVIVLLDDDAIEESLDLCMQLSRCVRRVTNVTLQGYHDAGDTPREEIWRQINLAIAAQEAGVING